MPIKEIVDSVLLDHDFGKPWKWGENAAGLLVPILLTREETPREYVLLEEAKDKVTIQDTGHIGSAKLVNKAGTHVFIRGGAVLAGHGTQSRAVKTGTVVAPGKQEVPINCIHASHGISQNANFEHKGYAPRKVAKALRAGGQSAVWASVSNYSVEARCQSLGSSSRLELSSVGTDNLVKTMEVVNEFKADVNDAIRRMPRAENQVGVVILDIKGVAGIELFDSPQSWKALCEGVMKQYSDLLEQKMPDYLSIDMDRVVVNIRAFLDLAKESTEQAPVDGTVVLNGKVSGEYTIFKERMIHLLLAREEPENNTGPVTRTASQHLDLNDFGAQTQDFQITGQTSAMDLSSATLSTSAPDQGELNNYFTKKGSVRLLEKLAEGEQKWTTLQPLFNSTHTQTRVLGQAADLGLVDVKFEDNNRRVYTLSAYGQEVLNQRKTRQ